MVAAMLKGNLCPPAHFAIQYNLQTSEIYISKALDLNDIKFSKAVNNAIFYIVSKVWTYGSKFA